MSYYMNDMTREELYSVISQMKRYINCLETDITKNQTLLKSYEKYFDYFNEINENMSINDQILAFINKMKKLRQFSENCLVFVSKPENDFNRLCIKSVETKVKSTDAWTQTFFKANPQMADNYESDSNMSDISLDFQKTELLFGVNEVNDNSFQNTNQLITENIRNFETINNQILFEDNDSDFNANEDNFSDNSGGEWVAPRTTSKTTSTNKAKKGTPNSSKDLNYDFIANEDNFSDNSDEEWVASKSTSKTTGPNKKAKKSTSNSSKELFYCQWEGCSAVLQTEKGLKDHQVIHTGQFSCDVDGCGFSARSNYHLIRHKGKHSDERPFVCCAQNCDKSYKFYDELSRHLKKFHSDLTLYVCEYPECGQTFSDPYSLKDHEDIHFGPLVCPSEGCDFRTSDQNHLERHQTNKHKEYICEHIGCGKQFGNSSNLAKHRHVHRDRVYECQWEGCDKKYSMRRTLAAHMDQHKGRFPCKWKGCDFKGQSNSDLRKHQNTHSKGIPFKCQFDDCDKQFKLKINLNRHHLREHPLEFEDFPWIECERSECHFKTKCKEQMREHNNTHNDLIECFKCQKKFKSYSLYKYHKRYAHSSDRFVCEWPECDRLFESREALDQHKNTHTGATQFLAHKSEPIAVEETNAFLCMYPGCDEEFIDEDLLKDHEAIHLNLGLFVCNINDCDFSANSALELKGHQLSGHNKRFVCEWPECDQLFQCREALEQHKNTHTGVKQYRCEWPECDRVFKWNKTLEQHMNVHTGDKQYTCDWPGCNMTFVLKSTFSSHMSRHKNGLI